ncbi:MULTISPECIES: type IV secretion system protein [Enterobacterales]|uniref:Pilx6 protein n=5 Tax=Enterobacterales TaxID=91347 RepID=A0A6H0A125_SERMA|nr:MULTISPECIES: type IV secretion system protein [Enterobacterales]AGT26778.1 Pilx6 protein [Klebsiella pneumoniae JM45]HDL8517160.1 type IV secretion system protein [Yersinia enterocolitica]ALK43885.1 Pilx6 protein [Enterobacter cloacae]ASK03904.1 pilus assembly protein [Citrobacter freundii]AVA18258.1 Type IV secretion system protein VirB6 [Citrobacter freundii]
MAGETSVFFQTAQRAIMSVLERSLANQTDGFINTAYVFGRYGVQIYALWYAYTVIAGKQRAPTQDFVWNLTRLFVILMFVKNMDGWLNYALTGIDGLKETLSGGANVWKSCDELWLKTTQAAAHIYSKDTTDYVKVPGMMGALFVYAGGILSLLAAAITFLMAEITIKLLAVTAPLFIFCLSYGFLRQMFNSWLQLIISSCLVLMFGSLALRAGTMYLSYILSQSISDASNGSNLIQIGATSLAAGIFMAFVIWQAKHYASQIAGVGVEGAMQGAAAMGMGALGFGAAKLGLGAAKRAGRGTMGFGRGALGQKGGFGKSTGVSGKAGNLVGQGARGAAQGTYSVGKAVVKQVRQRYGN